MPDQQRLSGILLHPTSLPSLGGIGDLGPAAYAFIDWLAEAKQGLWQLLPLGPVGLGNSPYSGTSAFAGNVLMISLERLVEEGWLERERLSELPGATGNVDFELVRRSKLPLLAEAARNFLTRAEGEARANHLKFCQNNSWWLDDYVLFQHLRRCFAGKSWNEWPAELALRQPEALAKLRAEATVALDVERFLQYTFFRQWTALHQYCRERSIRIVGDIAIFVSYDSADVWTHPSLFRLRENGEPEVVAGVPPDAFSSEGQRWGNPIYRWDVLRQSGYRWWVDRVRWALDACDILRLDHFRGFQQYWEIPASEPTAVNGHWVDGPKDDLFLALREQLGSLPFIAEDLGMITEDVHELRRRFQFPGMKVMQFGFGDPGAHIYLPHRFDALSVVYTGTHDNDTTAGWWQKLPGWERRLAGALLGDGGDGPAWAMIRSAASSQASYSIVPMQDVLSLGSEARMNTPSTPEGNWSWRLAPGALAREDAEKLAALVEVTDRLP